MNNYLIRFIKKFAWIILYISAVSIYLYYFKKIGDYTLLEDIFIVAISPLILIVASVIIERLIPHNKTWNKWDMQTVNNLLYIIPSNYANIYGKSLALFIAPLFVKTVNLDIISLWPASLPLFAQVIIALLVYDFAYYWYHRISHNSKILWRLHRLHHSTKHLNIFALNRFNVFDILIELLILTLVMFIVDMPTKVFYIIEGIMIPATMLSHANFDAPLPKFLNWIVITPTTHRVHHSTDEKQLNKNFGGFTLFWDIVFGTYEPVNEIKPVKTGLVNHKTSPWIWWQIIDFLKKEEN